MPDPRLPILRFILTLLLIALPAAEITLAQGSSAALSEEGTVFDAQGKKKYRKRQNRPIKMGTSGGSSEDFTVDDSFIHCCSGTLGALVEKNGKLHILSNNHVIARSNLGRKGDPIGQPGFIDQNPVCSLPDADYVADLTTYKKIKWGGVKRNKVDAAIAEVRPGAVDPSGEVVQIGIPGDTPVAPRIGMDVMKAGRTSGLTRGTIIAVNVTGTVTFEPRCGSEITKRARFVDQIVVEGRGKDFSRSGDSGAMVFEDVENCPPPVGLLFAGADEFSLINPANLVTGILGNRRPKGTVRFIGCSTAAAPSSQQLRSHSAQSPEPLLEDRQIRAATRAKELRENEILAVAGVQGVGVGITLSGPVQPAVYIFVSEEREQMIERLPQLVDGFPTEVIEVGPFVAY